MGPGTTTPRGCPILSAYAGASTNAEGPSGRSLPAGVACSLAPERPMPFRVAASQNAGSKKLPHRAAFAQDLQFSARTPTIRIRNRPAKQVGDQRWLNQHSTNRGSTRQSVLCAVSASPECLMNRGELHRLRTGSPAHCSRPSGPDSTSFFRISHSPWRRQHPERR